MTIANCITLFRLLPFAWFIYFAHRGNILPAALMFLLAWGLDVVDGWTARRLHQETPSGYVLDKAVDRLVLVGALFVLIVLNVVPISSLFLITKDALIIPAVVRRSAEGYDLRSLGVWGRAASVVQGLAVLWLMMDWPAPGTVIGIGSLFGVVVASRYLRQIKLQT